MLVLSTTLFFVPVPDGFFYKLMYSAFVGIMTSLLTLFLVGKHPNK